MFPKKKGSRPSPSRNVAVQEAVKSWTESGVKSPLMACLALRQRRFVKFLGMLFDASGFPTKTGGRVGRSAALRTEKPQKENNQRKSFKNCVFGGVNKHVLDGNYRLRPKVRGCNICGFHLKTLDLKKVVVEIQQKHGEVSTHSDLLPIYLPHWESQQIPEILYVFEKHLHIM